MTVIPTLATLCLVQRHKMAAHCRTILNVSRRIGDDCRLLYAKLRGLAVLLGSKTARHHLHHE